MTRNLPVNSITSFLMFALGLSTVLTGCGKDKPAPVAPPVRAVAAKPATPPPKPVQMAISSIVKPPPATVNQFDFSSKKDPFKPFVAVKLEPPLADVKPQKMVKESIPIHSYDVGQFKLIGIVTGEKENRAMVIDPGRKGYILKVGMTIGKNEGRVTSITAEGVDVLEQFRDDNGKVRKEKIKLVLPKKQ